MQDVPLHLLIATADRSALLARTLTSLADCEMPASLASTLVVENGPPGGAEQTTRNADPRLRCGYMHVPTANKSVALNAALRELRSAFVFMTDDDVRFAPGTLMDYAAAATAGPGHFFGGPTKIDYEAAPPPDWLLEYLPPSARGWCPTPDPSLPMELGFIGFNWGAFVEDLLEAGGFDAAHGPGSLMGSTGQETQMQKNLKARGVRPVFLPDAVVWHYVPASRCTHDWALRRSGRKGIEMGIRRARSGASDVRPLLRLAQYRVFAAAGGLMPARWRFHARFWAEHYRGVLEGARWERQQRVRQDESPAARALAPF